MNAVSRKEDMERGEIGESGTKMKSDLEIEDYLFFKVPNMHRSLLAQFRAGILPFSIEVGRYRNIRLDERLCTLCDDNVVEDEIHFL